MKCDKCGYSDNGTGDSAHACFVHALKQEEHKMNDQMKVKDLLQLLEGVDPETEVYLYFNNGITPASKDESEQDPDLGLFVIGAEPE